MATQEMVLVDTCIWVPYFNRPQSVEKKVVDSLIDHDRVALIGPILMEVLLGFRREQYADWVASTMRGLCFIGPTWNDWRAASKMGRTLIATGYTLPMSDLILAAVALNHNASIYSTDPHFDLIPSLKRFEP